MDENRQIGRLEAHLEELSELMASLVPDGPPAVALYDRAGRLLAAAGAGHFPATVPQAAPDAPADGGTHAILSGGAAFSRLDGERAGAAFFALRPGRPVAADTLAGLLRIGARFLERTLALLAQTESLQQLVREQEAIIDHISDGLIVLDAAGTLRFINAPGARMLGLDATASIGRRFRELVDFEPLVMRLFETGQGYVDREMQLRSRKIELDILDTAVPILDDRGRVISIVNTFHEMARARQLSNRIAGDRARYRFSDVTGQSPLIRQAVTIARRAALSDVTVLLCGESGTGKEIFAQSIHNESRRAGGPFVAVNCAALPRDLIESEMFGYSPGSFTGADKSGRMGRFELASGGTIFLDEISEMPLDVQAKLLRVLQEKQVTRIGATASTPVDIRVIAAANRDLRALIEAKAFREDLYYRLNVMRIDLPALRDRREDIALLAIETARRAAAVLHRPALRLSDRALHQLSTFDWPGNVRQLQNIIERLANLTDGDLVEEIPADWLFPERTGSTPTADTGPRGPVSLAEAERHAIRTALEATGFNLTRAAAVLGITRPTLYAKMRRYGLQTEVRLRGGN